MDKIDTKLVAHIGAELVIIGGITFYFHKKIKDLSEKVENLEKQNDFYRQAIETHESYLRDLIGTHPQRNHNNRPRRGRLPTPRQQPQRPSHNPPPLPEESDPEFDNEDLDAELEDVEEDYEECDGGVCSLKDK